MWIRRLEASYLLLRVVLRVFFFGFVLLSEFGCLMKRVFHGDSGLLFLVRRFPKSFPPPSPTQFSVTASWTGKQATHCISCRDLRALILKARRGEAGVLAGGDDGMIQAG
jgi:hypothetical protein